MSTALNVKDLLCKQVCNAQSVYDIMPLVSSIPLMSIKGAILSAVRDLDPNTANDLRYKCFSMTHILPHDIIQHIVSFTDCCQLKYIDKTFNSGYNKNKSLQLKHRKSIVDKQTFTPNIPFTKRNETWIIHPTRTRLNHEEIANGYRGPLNTLKHVESTVRTNDKILVHDGNYTYYASRQCRHDLQFIGIGNNVSIELGNDHANKLYLVAVPFLWKIVQFTLVNIALVLRFGGVFLMPRIVFSMVMIL
eukprot:1026724_1